RAGASRSCAPPAAAGLLLEIARSLMLRRYEGEHMRLMIRLAAAVVALPLALTGVVSAHAADAEGTTLRFIPQADLRVLDPMWTTATITRDHGYMVYDTLFALDEHF